MRHFCAGLVLASAMALPAAAEPCDTDVMVRSGGTDRARLCLDETVYVVTQDNGVQVYAIGDPADPELLTSFQTRFRPVGIAAAGDTLYIAEGFSGIFLADVTDPERPVPLGSVTVTDGDFVAHLSIDGNTLYAIGEKLWVFDISEPRAPVLISDLTLPDFSPKALVAGDVLIALDERDTFFDTAELFLIDVSDPANPVLGQDIFEATGLFDFTIEGDTLATFSGSAAVFLDISEPAAPTLLAEHPIDGDPRSVAASATHAYLATEEGTLRVFEIADAANITPGGSIEGVYSNVTLSGGKLLGGGLPYGLTVVSLDDPANPSLELTLPFPVTPANLSFSGRTAYAPDGIRGVGVLDLARPDAPLASRFIPVPDAALASAVRDDRLYIADTQDGILTYDIADPRDPFLLPAAPVAAFAREMLVDGDTLFVAESEGLLSVEILPDGTLGESTLTPGTRIPVGLQRVGNRLYVAGDALDVFDISDPRTPILTGSVDLFPDSIRAIGASGDRLVIVRGTNDAGFLHVLSLADPDAPSVIGTAGYPRRGMGLQVHGDTAAVAIDRNGVSFFDISDPSNIVEIANIPHPADQRSLDRNGSTLYIGLFGGLVAVDASCFGFPCGPADFAEPLGVLDLADIVAFVTAFTTLDPAADLDGNGLFDLTDITASVGAFTAGCP